MFGSLYFVWFLCILNISMGVRGLVKKVKCTLVQALRLCTGRTARGGVKVQLYTFSIKGVRGQRQVPAALYPRERPRTHCTWGWVGTRVGLDRCGKSRLPPEFDPRTIQSVASCFMDYAIRPTRGVGYVANKKQTTNACIKLQTGKRL
jgi:hypothetical protein